MSNDFFRFKQFTVRQDRCAMKVSTDACIQGAWTPLQGEAKRILDIGAGTGLLSMMLAQRHPEVLIDAVELEQDAAMQAKENVQASPFAHRVQVIRTDASQWRAPYSYDLIICNPPFFKKALLGPDPARNAARHIDSLGAEVLIGLVNNLLSPEGHASFLWPAEGYTFFVNAARQSGIYLQKQLNIRHRPGSQITRVVGIFGRWMPEKSCEQTLIIKDAQEHYTESFVQLLRPFYLYL